MKTSAWKKIALKSLDPNEWTFQGRLAYKTPGAFVLTGYLAEGSGFDTGVYLWQVRLPLFIPTTDLVLTYSHRLDSEKFYENDQLRFARVLDNSLSPARAEAEFLEEMSNSDINSPNRRLLEIRAYSNIILGEKSGAYESLDKIQNFHADSSWQHLLTQRCAQVRSAYSGDGREAVLALLNTWTAETCTALRIVKRAYPAEPEQP